MNLRIIQPKIIERHFILFYMAVILSIIFAFFLFIKSASASDVAFYVSTTTRYGNQTLGSNSTTKSGQAFFNYYGDQDLTKWDLYISENVVDEGLIENDYDFCLTSYNPTSITPTDIYCETKIGSEIDALVGEGNAGYQWLSVVPTTTITLASSTYYELQVRRNSGSSVDESELLVGYGQNTLIYSTTERKWYNTGSTKTWDDTSYRDWMLVLYESGVECGNNVVEDGEQCDDGNLDNYDGCDSSCQNEEYTYNQNSIVWELPDENFTWLGWSNVDYVNYSTTTLNNYYATGQWIKNIDYGTTITFNGAKATFNSTYLNEAQHVKMSIFDENRNFVKSVLSTEVLNTGTSTELLFYIDTPIDIEYGDSYYFMYSLENTDGYGAYVATYYSITADSTYKRRWIYKNYPIDTTGNWRLDFCNGGDNTCPNRYTSWNTQTDTKLLYGDYIPSEVQDETFTILWPTLKTLNTYGVQCADTPFPFVINYNTYLPSNYYYVIITGYASTSDTVGTTTLTQNLGLLDTDDDGYFTLPESFTATTTFTKHKITVYAMLQPNSNLEADIFYTAWEYPFLLYCDDDPTLPNPYIAPDLTPTNWFFQIIENNFSNKFPFSYVYDIKNIFSNIIDNMNEFGDLSFTFNWGASTSTITFINSSTPYQVASQNFWSTLRTIFRAILWLAFIYYIWHRLKYSNFPNV